MLRGHLLSRDLHIELVCLAGVMSWASNPTQGEITVHNAAPANFGATTDFVTVSR